MNQLLHIQKSVFLKMETFFGTQLEQVVLLAGLFTFQWLQKNSSLIAT